MRAYGIIASKQPKTVFIFRQGGHTTECSVVEVSLSGVRLLSSYTDLSFGGNNNEQYLAEKQIERKQSRSKKSSSKDKLNHEDFKNNCIQLV